MKNKIGAFIIYNYTAYPYELNKDYFEMHRQIISQNTLYSKKNVLFLKNDLPYTHVDHDITTAFYEQCIFVFQGEELNYPEYLI